ncbi:hypothetical protein ACHAQA_009598 [Verticillium albo-atrum]
MTGRPLDQTFIPAASKWFHIDEATSRASFSPYMDQFAHHLFPYELISPQLTEKDGVIIDGVKQFLNWLTASSNPMDAVLAGIVHSSLPPPTGSDAQFCALEAPLLLLLKAVEYNKLNKDPIKKLYIAQSQLADLPKELREDLPTPSIVKEAGKGDVYSSSIWMGVEPTYTPLHRDPNPNLFCQLHSNKTVRLLPPKSGERLYRQVQTKLGRPGNSRIRSAGMMEGPERVMMNAAVWGEGGAEDIVEAHLKPGDALFIPTGWWHSIKSNHLDGRLNASVNWWFR